MNHLLTAVGPSRGGREAYLVEGSHTKQECCWSPRALALPRGGHECD